jgi:hypothetical protein
MFKIDPKEQRTLTKHTAFCHLPFTKLILNSWGDVSMCCHQTTQLGRLDEKTNVLDLWNSHLAREIRDFTTKGNLHPVCSSWNSCPFMVSEKWDYTFLQYRRSAYPMYLEICLPDKHCNIGGEKPSEENPACIMCRRNFHTPDQQDITDFLCEKAKPLMPYLRYLCVLGIAEPFWKDAVFNIFNKLDFERYKDRIEFTTNTNGTCLNEKMTRKFFETVNTSDLSWSLDSATPETHIKIRRLDAFDLVVKNLRRWVVMREEYGGKKKHKVCVYNNINMFNVHEMTKMVELSHDIGVDKMIMLPTYDQSGVVQLGEMLMCEKNLDIFKKSSEEAMMRSQELGVKLYYSKKFDELPPPVEDSRPTTPEHPHEANLVQLDLNP